jgi:hypothetical protein
VGRCRAARSRSHATFSGLSCGRADTRVANIARKLLDEARTVGVVEAGEVVEEAPPRRAEHLRSAAAEWP